MVANQDHPHASLPLQSHDFAMKSEGTTVLPQKRRRSSSHLAPGSNVMSGCVKVEVESASSSSQVTTADATVTEDSSSLRAKKLKIQATFSSDSPFPDWPRPTREEALEVYEILSRAHHDGSGPELIENRRFTDDTSVPTKNPAETRGNVPNVIDALIGTVLSQNTSARNSSAAKSSVDATFGRLEEGFKAIAAAPKSQVVDAIRSGGLANKKAEVIQGLLKGVKSRHGRYSLQHLAGEDVEGSGKAKAELSNDDIIKELISYPGIGPKTASCVLLFCLARPSFAVDTHVFRLSKLLGWVPQSVKDDRVRAQMHLDLRIPDDLKYGLHVLMIRHGRACKGCKIVGASNKSPCILKEYLRGRGKAK